ncbi:hypothetical protein BU24DRAFT_495173 [Aaosphaeria arxii CBS 175.79]|uniref:Rhodopsin domain-containing protein n=1 Tax=Aaosphaeria arxii CBS 175.79 TaxID=1450172 RepID=A0A6A5XGV2_9PLEO|nr:uncharacterized protein BU24DRAFT_495173 [Aaosphaeria arxii CBS 175.79]KAF2012096.1 hypothetical protein BU24DRAFT_495173 [Aaosphaeria arxii CBS 175.79]
MGSASSVPADYEEPARGITAFLIVLTTVGIFARLIARRIQRAERSVDDYLAALAYLANLGLLITLLLVADVGGVSLTRMAKMSKEDQRYLKDSVTALAFLYTFAIILVKLSVLFMYRRIFTMNEKWFRIDWMGELHTSISMLHRYGIHPYRMASRKQPKVWSQQLAMVWKLMLPIREKFAITGLFGLGMIATAISIMRVVRFDTKREEHWNPAYSFYNDMLTSASETSAGLPCSCLTIIKPLLRRTRDIAVSSVTGLTNLLSSGSGSHGRSTASGSNSVRSDNVSLHSRKQHEGGITKIHQYNIDSDSLPPGSSQRDLGMNHIHPWETRESK